MSKLLEVKNLKTYFTTSEGITRAVDDISFTLNRGETLGIVGESGSGKSVTSLSIMQLIQSPGKIEGGEIIYYTKEGKEIDLLKLSEDEIRTYRGSEMSMIFQEPMTSLNPVLTCGSQITETIQLHLGIDKSEARLLTLELFKQVQLPEPKRIFKAYPHELSGGQKQRVMIAMALSCKPKILIADEPTTALDVTVQRKILDLIEQINADVNRAAVIFISHDLGVIAEIADKVLVMYKGKIVEQGEVKKIFQNPQHPYTKGLLACRPPLDRRLKRLPTISDFMEEVIENGEMVLKEKPNSVEKAFQQHEIKVETFEERLERLVTQPPVLEVKKLKTFFKRRENWMTNLNRMFKNIGKKPSDDDFIKAVNDVSFKVYKGETLGLVGESGCGKTTLGRSILKLVETHSGEVLYNNQSILDLSTKQLKAFRKDVQIIFQDPYSSLNPRKTIGSAILEPMKVHNILENDEARKRRVYELLKTVALEDKHYHRYPHEFSGGQRQRICIARALAVEPKFIICDESVSALDVSVQAQILNLLMELRDQFQLTYIFISHDLSVVKLISDRIMVMNNGKVEEIGNAEQVYHSPKSEYTQRLIAAIPAGILND
jgi:peptide/nickel transport system ATP-binding protein